MGNLFLHRRCLECFVVWWTATGLYLIQKRPIGSTKLQQWRREASLMLLLAWSYTIYILLRGIQKMPPVTQSNVKVCKAQMGKRNAARFLWAKQMVCEPPLLSYMDFKMLQFFESEVSEHVAGAEFSQKDGFGKLRPVQSFSCTINDAEWRHIICEKRVSVFWGFNWKCSGLKSVDRKIWVDYRTKRHWKCVQEEKLHKRLAHKVNSFEEH